MRNYKLKPSDANDKDLNSTFKWTSHLILPLLDESPPTALITKSNRDALSRFV